MHAAAEVLEDWYEVTNVGKIDSPALLVYSDHIRSNIRKLVDMVGNVSLLQPHMKTSKCAEVAKIMMEFGIDKFKCATIAEAEMLALAGASKVLIAYPMVGPKVDRMVKLMLVYPDTEFSCLVDCPEQARHLSAHTYQADVHMRLYVDLNVGTDRTGISPSAGAAALYDFCKNTSHLIVEGFHIYDGHINCSCLDQRKALYDKAYSEVWDLVKDLSEKYQKTIPVIAGGSCTFPLHAEAGNVICSPGTFVYWDKGYQELLPEQPFDFGALVLARVISRPSPDLVCLDLGYKSIASEGPLDKRAYFLNFPGWKLVSHSEEHMVVRESIPGESAIGQEVFVVPYHVCPTVAMYDRVLVVEEKEVSACWNTLSRRRKINI